MCASVCPSEALWYGTIEQFDNTRRGSLFRDFMFGRQEVRTKVYTVVDDAVARPTRRRRRRHHELARRPLRPRAIAGDPMNDDIPTGPRRAALEARLPLRGAVGGGGHPPRVRPLPRARRRHHGGGQRRHRRMDPAAQHQRRGPAPDHAPRGSRRRWHLPVPLSGGRRPGDPRPPHRRRGRRVQPEVHPPRLRRLLRARRAALALPLPRRQLRSPNRQRALRPTHPTARPHRPRGPRRRHDLGDRRRT